MKRLAAIVAGVLAPAVVVAVTAAGGGEEGYRVDAVFDNTASLIPGQDVKIAGARVGSVREIHLTPDRRARVEMEVETGFAPFGADATCTIRPQSLIGEKFVQCDPGTPGAGPLPGAGDDGGVPTVAVERTSSPVDLDLVFAALRRPYRERLAIIVNELGTGLAGRPRELSRAIRRANPALREANEVLAILDRDRDALGRLVERSDEVLEALAAKDREAQSLIVRAESVTREVAEHEDGLEEAIRRLPPLLDELEPSARSLSALARDATPVVRDLRASAPGLRALLADLEPLSQAAAPALTKLSELSRTGGRAVRAARPVAERLRPVAALLPPVVATATELVESLRSTGAVEGILGFVYYGSAATARFDTVSHIVPSYQITGSCQQYATVPAPGCSARFGGAGETAAARRTRRERRPRGRERAGERPGRAGPRGPGGADDRRSSPARPRPPAFPQLPRPSAPPTGPVTPLLDFLLGP